MGVAAVAVPLGASLAFPMAAAHAASSEADASGWHVGYINSSNKALSMAQATPSPGGATFNFTNQPNTALLINTKGSGTDLTGKTVSATVRTTGVNGTLQYGGEPDGSGRVYGAPLFRDQ
jgi:hypothetical protein